MKTLRGGPRKGQATFVVVTIIIVIKIIVVHFPLFSSDEIAFVP